MTLESGDEEEVSEILVTFLRWSETTRRWMDQFGAAGGWLGQVVWTEESGEDDGKEMDD